MCDPKGFDKTAGHTAAYSLARFLERELDLSEGIIDGSELRSFIRDNWSRVTIMAHTIHEAE